MALIVSIRSYAKFNKTHITYAHSFEWENDDPNDEMIAAFIELPQAIPNTGLLHCKMGRFKTVTCLQAILLNKNELNQLKEVGPQAFSEYLYPQNDEKRHFLSERHRSEKF